MMNIKNLVLGGIAVLALSSCASLPVATYTTSSGCGIAQWNQQWVQQNVESMSWTGSCVSDLAQGNGTLLVKLKNGKQREYVGAMDKGFIHGDGTYTKESGWKYQGNFLWLTFTRGRIYTADGQLLFDGLMAHNEKYNGQNITFNDQRYHQGKIYFPDGGYIDDGQYTGSAGPALGIASIDPQTGRGIVYGKYMKDGRIVYRWVDGKQYSDDGSYHQAFMQHYDRLNAALDVEIAAAKKVQAERRAKDRQETYALLGKAANAAAAGTNATERKQLALNALAAGEPSASGSGTSGSSSSGVSSSSMGTVGGIEIVALMPPPGVRSRNECMKVEWITSPLPRSQAGDTRLIDHQFFSDRNYLNQRQLVAYSTCAEDLVFTAGACSDDVMLKSGEHVGTSFETNFINRGAKTDVRILLASEYSTNYGRGEDERHAPKKVFVGAWLATDLRDSSGLTDGGASHQRKVQALLAKARVVLGQAAGTNVAGRHWSPRSRLADVKSCSAFTAEETWNNTR